MSRTPKSRRQKIRSGQYKPCRRGFLGFIRCTGEITNDGAPRMCPKCRGDGLIKIGGPGRGRPRGRGKSKGKGRKVGPVARPVIGAAACWVGCLNVFGETLGPIVAVVAMVVMLALWILGGVAQAFGLVSK